MKKKIKYIFIILIFIILMTFNQVNASDDIIVMLDPGHGGTESGAVYGGVVEKTVNWKIAKRVKEIFDKTPGITGILTRTENTNPSLKERGIMAKNNNADLLVSFHINSNTYSNSANGAEVYITGNTNSVRYYQNSKKLAENVLSNLRSIGVASHSPTPLIRWSTDGELYEDGFLSDYYGIIRNPMYYGIPGVLIEHCYINNTNDRVKFLSSDEKINSMAEADAKAIISNKDLFKRTYSGDINTDLKNIELSKNSAGKKYIYGKILIAEWINGVANIPNGMPEMTLKSTDGKYSQKMYIKHESGLEYYFDKVIEGIDTNKEYYIEVKLTNKNNISKNIRQNVKMVSKTVGQYTNAIKLKIQNNRFKFVNEGYKGEINTDLQTMKVGKNAAGREYIYGEILIAEWINGVANTPNGIPEMTLKSKDGTYSQNMYVKNLGGLKYYYDRVIYNLNTNKEYYIEVKLTNKNNISNKKMQNAQIRNVTNIGTLNGRSLVVANNVIKFNKGYIGEINTDLQTMKVGKNAAGREYIYGEILIAEWINGVANTPNGIPGMILKSTDGTYSQNMYVKNLGGLKYYYDRVIYNLDTNKEYYIEVKLTNKDNISDKKIQKAKMRNIGEIGTLNSKKISVSNNTIKFKVTQYKGEINTDLQTMKVGKNAAGREYIYGEILIAEWINGVANTPNGIPEMTLKSTDGTYSQKMYVKHEGGLKYYYDRVIYNLDINKEYYIEVKLTNSNNVSNKKIQNANIRVKGQIGTLKSYKINVSNNKINFIK